MALMKLQDIVNSTLFNEAGTFCRTDMPIRMLAVHKYVETGKISNIWWRMQYGKLWFNWGKKGYTPQDFWTKMGIQRMRLSGITSVFMKGEGLSLGPIVLGNNHALIDGSHRLSCYIYFNIDDVPVAFSDKNGHRPGGEDVLIREWYTDSEWDIINLYKEKLILMSGGEKWVSPLLAGI